MRFQPAGHPAAPAMAAVAVKRGETGRRPPERTKVTCPAYSETKEKLHPGASVTEGKARGWSNFLTTIYEEYRPAKGVATSAALVAGLVTYHCLDDPVTGVGVGIAFFAAGWVSAEPVSKWLTARSQERRQRQRTKSSYKNLGHGERTVVEGFVRLGGCVIECKDSYQRSDFPGNGIESLASKGLLQYSTTADGYRETYALDRHLYDYARTQLPDEPF